MTRALSLYLDLLRCLAALAVYLSHAQYFSKARFPIIGNLGSEAVIIFFVLSGLVIAAAKRSTDMNTFVQTRLARLWSVCLPALCLTLVLDMIGQYVSLASYHPMQPYTPFKWAAAIGINALFLNQIWNFNIYPGTNGPFWSLSYEFWYYMLFGAFVYLRGMKRVLALFCAALVVGPWILMAFPIWLLGAMVYAMLKGDVVKQETTGWMLWLGSLVSLSAFAYFGCQEMLREIFPQSAAAARWGVNFWPSSYLIGIMVTMNILGFALIGKRFTASLEKISPLLRFGANVSFGLYLFHYPLMYFCKAVLNSTGVSKGVYYIVFIYVVPLVLSTCVAVHCEKYRGFFAQLIQTMASVLPKRLLSATPGDSQASQGAMGEGQLSDMGAEKQAAK